MEGGGSRGHIATDATHIYWTNEGANTIGRANLDGSDRLPNFITGLPVLRRSDIATNTRHPAAS